MFIQEEDRKKRRKEDRNCFLFGFLCGILLWGAFISGQFFLLPLWR